MRIICKNVSANGMLSYGEISNFKFSAESNICQSVQRSGVSGEGDKRRQKMESSRIGIIFNHIKRSNFNIIKNDLSRESMRGCVRGI